MKSDENQMITSTETSDAISKHLEALTPKSLDDIFRRNREIGTIKLADNEQLQPLLRPAPGRHAIRGVIEEWRFIGVTFDIPAKEIWAEHVFLFGSMNRGAQITSAIKSIDLKRKLVVTQNSVYRLAGEPGVGEPGSYDLMYIAGAFNAWGWGPIFGIPEFFL